MTPHSPEACARAGLLTPGDHKHRCPKCHESKFCPHACTYCEDQSEGQAVPHGYYAECEDCSKPRATVRIIPYAGVSNPMPRTTAEERAAITHLAAIAHLDLLSYEPEHALLERSAHRAAQYRNRIDPQPHKAVGENPGGLRVTASEWRAHWRSLPDYDCGRNAPSGVEFCWSETGLVIRRVISKDGEPGEMIHIPWLLSDARAYYTDLETLAAIK